MHRQLVGAQLRLPAKADGGRELVLPVLAAVMPGPGSFTGEDMAELQMPGHPALLDRVLHRAIALGARLAEPGEFTFRAYLAGKLDLTEAEGVAATVAAVSDSQLQAATLLREGKLGRVARELVDALATQLALVEAGIDFVDQEDVVPISPGALADRLDELAGQLRTILDQSRSWGAIESLPRVVLAGPPSAGKSTLFNALLGRDRAVIDASPGTTRDVLAEPLSLMDAAGRPVEVMLVDLAGLDATPAHPLDGVLGGEPIIRSIDQQAQAAARQALREADLILCVADGSTASPDAAVQDLTRIGVTSGAAPLLRVDAKADLTPRQRSDQPRLVASDGADAFVRVSAHTGEGLDALRGAIARVLAGQAVSLAADTLALQPRHEQALRAAASDIDHALSLTTPQRDDHALEQVELIAGALRGALDALAGLGGEMTPDDVIGRVFATFCIGK